jgi:hypothetical protein
MGSALALQRPRVRTGGSAPTRIVSPQAFIFSDMRGSKRRQAKMKAVAV